jgi:ferredoxin
MAQQLHIVDTETCLGDGICVDVCPENTLEIVDEKASSVEDRAEFCIECGQCVAVCPTESLTMPKLPMEDFRKLAERPFGYDEFSDFLRLRRSVRVFKDKPVERDIIEKILDAAATAPMGLPPHSNPVGRAMVRLMAGPENFGVLKNHVVDVAKFANELYHRDGVDRYMYRAPVLMLFHGNRWTMSYEENAHLVCHHSMLAALSLRLGSTIIGLVPPIVDRSKVLRERYGIPKDNKVCTSLVLGYPKFKYRQGIRRNLAGVTYH